MGKIGVTNWTDVAKDRKKWRTMVMDAQTRLGLYNGNRWRYTYIYIHKWYIDGVLRFTSTHFQQQQNYTKLTKLAKIIH